MPSLDEHVCSIAIEEMRRTLILNRESCYAASPLMTVDANRRIVDFNIATRVLFGSSMSGARGRELSEVEGNLAACVGGDPRDLSLQSEKYGNVTVRCCSNALGVGAAGSPVGWTLRMDLLVLQQEGLFRAELENATRHERTWELYAESYDRVLPELYFYQDALDRHIQALSSDEIQTIIDVGAGTGNFAYLAFKRGKKVTAVESSRAMMGRLREKCKSCDVNIALDSAEDLSAWEAGVFDGANILLSLYDMSCPSAALSETIRVLRPGGRIVVTEPRKAFNLGELLKEGEKHLRKKGVFDELSEDWHRVTVANGELDPKARTVGSRMWAEDIIDYLRQCSFEELVLQDSHNGNCATISGRRSIRA